MNVFELDDLYGKSNHTIAAELGKRFRDYRVNLRLSQKDISNQTGLSVMTIVRFENGEGASLRFGSFLALLRAVQLLQNTDLLIPDLPDNLYWKPRKKSERVRRKGNEK